MIICDVMCSPIDTVGGWREKGSEAGRILPES